jgi:CarboxypepD_reg-like domain
MKKLLTLSYFFFHFSLLMMNAQNFTQVIKGKVIDRQSQMSLPGVNVIISGSNPVIATATDSSGFFKFEKVPVGRTSLELRYVGYQTVNLNNLSLNTGKELMLTIEMEEKVTNMEEVVVKGTRSKIKPLNEMATVSARSFTIEESQRYAGANNDVSRMAQNYAGVSSANDAENSIVVRGNTPNGLLWKLEGVDIPNPNHFGNMGATGGPVGMLNNNVLANSDFLTSAFPAEYGNAISGVFDIKMRDGNDERYEFLGQIGFNGFELGAEGPISRSNHSSYLINYRYSTLGVLAKMGVSFGTGTAIPYYQDLTFKINFPTKGFGTFELFGLGGLSRIDFLRSGKNWDESGNLYSDENQDIYAKYESGVVGFNHTYHPDATSYTKLSVALSGLGTHDIVDSISLATHNPLPYYRGNQMNTNIEVSLIYNKKFSSRHNLRLGINTSRQYYNLVDSAFITNRNLFVKYFNFSGSTYLSQAYAQWQYRFTDELMITPGIHLQQLSLNNHFAVEPRIGFRWQFQSRQAISLGYGLNSKAEPEYMLIMAEKPDHTYDMLNKNLDFIKSHHFVAGYEFNFSSTLRFKTEIYYQYIYSAIVERKPSFFSSLNAGSMMNTEIPDSTSNKGKGKNYGIEFTFEKFLDKGFYMLLTTSLFDSKYQGSNGIWRNTAFNSKYVVNLLAGKDFRLGSKNEAAKSKKWLSVDARLTAAGGQRYTPVDTALSDKNHTTEYLENLAFTQQFPNYFRADIRIAYRQDNHRFSQEFAVDIQNVTNHDNPLFAKYNQIKHKIDLVNQLGIFPMVEYKLIF